MKFDPTQLYLPEYIHEEIDRCRSVTGQGFYETGLLVDANNVMYMLAFAASKEVSDEHEMLAVFEDKIKAAVKDTMASVVICGIDSGVSLRRSMLGSMPKPDKTPEEEAVIALARKALHLLKCSGNCKYNPCWMDGYEADDIVGAYAVSGLFVHSVMYSSDSDLQQVTDKSGVVQLSPARGQQFLKSPIPPELVPGVKALAGDRSDSVVGIKGVGPKTALAIMQGTKELDLDKETTLRIVNNLTLTALPFPGSFQCLNELLVPWPEESWRDYVSDANGEIEEDALPF